MGGRRGYTFIEMGAGRGFVFFFVNMKSRTQGNADIESLHTFKLELFFWENKQQMVFNHSKISVTVGRLKSYMSRFSKAKHKISV